MKPRIVCIAVAITLFIFLPGALSAQELSPGYELDWWTMDSGGAAGGSSSTGGGYSLSGTLGQPDADPEPASGGGYGLNGGFWLGTPGLVIAMTVSNLTPWEGQIMTYTVMISNTGTAVATGVIARDSLAGNLAEGISLADGQGLTYVYTATVADGPMTVINTASARSIEDPGGVFTAVAVNWLNRPPTAQAGGPYAVAEGDTAALHAQGRDVPGDPLTYAWDLDGDGAFESSGPDPTFSAASLDGPTTVTVTVQVQDDDGGVTAVDAQVAVSNVAPRVDAGPDWLDTVAGRVRVDASITDPGLADSHTASVAWGDGVVEAAPVSNGRVQASHLYGQGGYTATVTVTDDDDGVGTDSFQVRVGRPFIYLPIVQVASPDRVRQRFIYLPMVHVAGPDLVVSQLSVGSDGVQITLRNQGSGVIQEDFWVELYVNPQPAPSRVDQLWSELGIQGGVWGVLQDLAPGDSITLSVGDRFYYAEYSTLPGVLAAGTTLYVQVDSWNEETTYGAVLEGHESTGQPTNNILGPVTLSQPVTLPGRSASGAERRPHGPALPERDSRNP